MTAFRLAPTRRHAQQGAAARGVLVAAGLVAAVGLQLAGSQLQGRLATWLGLPRLMPVPSSAPACSGGRPCASSGRPGKVAVAVAAAGTGSLRF